MFLKPFKVKAESLLKASEKKKLRVELENQWPLMTPDALDDLIPVKCDILAVRIITVGGDGVIVYFHLHQPILFEVIDVIYPTVYTAWRFPSHMVTVQTWAPSASKLMQGADLMTNLISAKGELAANVYPHIVGGRACCVSTVDNRYAVAVGMACLSGEAMAYTGMKGRAIQNIHHYGDQLWVIGCKGLPPWIIAQLPTELQILQAGDEDSVRPKADEPSSPGEGDLDDSLMMENHLIELDSGGEDLITHSPSAYSLLQSMDEEERLYKCFLYALRHKIQRSELPMPITQFYNSCMKACCPPELSIDVRKTHYKQLIEFMVEMESSDFVMIKEVSKGVHHIIEINRSHRELRNFIAWGQEKKESDMESSFETDYEPPEIDELLMVNPATLPFFSKLGFQKGDKLSKVEVETFLMDYVKAQNLQHPNHHYLQLDVPLSQAVLNPPEHGQLEYIKWTDLMERLSMKMRKVYQLQFSCGTLILRKTLPQIQATLETRQPDKKVCTVVSHLDQYGIDVKTLSKQIRTVRACSTSITVQQNGPQVIAPGNHLTFIYKLLREKYRIPNRHLDIPI